MSDAVKASIVGAIVVLLFSIMGTMWWFATSNTEIKLKNQIFAQQKSCETVFDKTWKIISQKAQIADKYKDAFKQIYPELMAGRYNNARGGSMMSWVQESNPNFDVSLYKDLMIAIEAQRNEFNREQQKLIDLKREHDTLRQTFPASIVVGNRKEIVINIVTSSKTKETFVTGEENDIKL